MNNFPLALTYELHHFQILSRNLRMSLSGSEEESGSKKNAEIAAEDRILVVKDLEKVFGYRLQRKRKGNEEDSSDQKELQNYFGQPTQSFVDRNFECRPYCDRIPLHDGSFESEDNRKHRLDNNIAQKTDQCKCLGSEVSEELEGPYYSHLAAAPTIAGIRKIMEARFGESGEAVRIEKVVYTGKEGRTQDGCPLAKWIIRRSSYKEKLLCLIRERPGHKCATAVLCVFILLWEGIPANVADDLYTYLVRVLPTGGMPTNRRCALNDQRTCACQGMNDLTGGASFSFGCSWSMYYNTCKFARSRNPKRFKLMEPTEESIVERKLQLLSDIVAQQYAKVAPVAYRNQAYFSYRAQECRLGNEPCGPFTGVTACVDFCSHSHRDVHNMSNGCTIVASLTKYRGLEKAEDEQYHVLPLYIPAKTDEHGSEEGQKRKVESGALEVLSKYPMLMRYRKEPLPNCKERNKRPCPSTRPSSPPAIQNKPEPHLISPNPYYPHHHSYSFGGFHPAYGEDPYPIQPPAAQPFSAYAPQNGFYPTMAPHGWCQPQPYHYPADYGGYWPKMENYCDPMFFGNNRRASYGGPEQSDVPPAPVDPDAPPEGFYTVQTDNEHAFADQQIGGIGISYK